MMQQKPGDATDGKQKAGNRGSDLWPDTFSNFDAKLTLNKSQSVSKTKP